MLGDREELALRKTKELLSDPSKWCKGALARTEEGKPINPRDDAACSWCLSGAIAKFDPSVRCLMFLMSLEDDLRRYGPILGLGTSGIETFNDAAIHKDVINLLEEALS